LKKKSTFQTSFIVGILITLIFRLPDLWGNQNVPFYEILFILCFPHSIRRCIELVENEYDAW